MDDFYTLELDGPADSELVEDDRSIECDLEDDYSYDFGVADERYAGTGIPAWSAFA